MIKERAWPAKAMYLLIAAALAISLIIVAAPAHRVSAETIPPDAEWDRVPTPVQDDWVLAPESVIIDYAIGDEGEVAYAIVDGYNVNEGCAVGSPVGMPGDWLLKSENHAATWDDLNQALVKTLEDENANFELNNVMRVATDGMDADFLAVAIEVRDTEPSPDTFSVHVLVSSDGGATFYDTDDDGVDATAFGPYTYQVERRVLDLAVSTEVNGKRAIAIVGSDEFDALIFGCTAYEDHSTDWEDATQYDGWGGSRAITDVKFSPNWADDSTILVTTVVLTDSTTYADDLYTIYLQSGVWGETTQAWNADADFEPAVDVLEEVYSEGVALPQFVGEIDARGIAGLTLPQDYDGTEALERYVWVWVNYDIDYTDNTNVEAEGILMRVVDGTAGPVREDGQIPGNPWLTNVDYLGDIDSGKALAGVLGTGGYKDQTSNSTAIGELSTVCCEGVMVYSNDGIADMNTCCENWEAACKLPTGRLYMEVFYASDDLTEDKAYAVALQGIDDYAMYDEGAWSVSMDDGYIWNQLSLVDTHIDYFSDVAVSPGPEDEPCNKLLLVSINEGRDCGCDSVWLHAEDLHGASEYSGQWVRTWCSNLAGNHGILRLVPYPTEEEAETVYLVDRGTDDLYWWEDDSETWGCWEDGSAKVLSDIVDLAVSDEKDVIYALDSDGHVAKGTDYGSTNKWLEAVDSKVNEGCTIAVWGDDILVGGCDGDVSHSDDGGETFTKLEDIADTGYVTVAFDSYFDLNHRIYAALAEASGNDNGVYRWIIGTSEAWKDLMAEPLEYQIGIPSFDLADDDTVEVHFSGLVLDNAEGNPETTKDTGGVLYASYYGQHDGKWFTGVARYLTPAEDVVCKPCGDWDYLIVGLIDDENTSYHEAWKGWPDALKICGCLTPDTNSKLFAIDRYGNYDMQIKCLEDSQDGAVWMFEDCYAKNTPKLLSPADKAPKDADPCSCYSVPFTLTWERLCDACSYEIQFARDKDFNELVPVNDEEDLTIHVQIEGGSCFYSILGGEAGKLSCEETYYWRVRAADAATGQIIHSPWSDGRSFSIGASSQVRVNLVSPEPDARDVAVTNIAFSWSSVPGAKYSLVLSANSDLSSAKASQTELTVTSYEYKGTALAYETPYFWQVTAVKGDVTIKSDVGTFYTMAEPEEEEEKVEPVPFWVWIVIAIGAVLVIVVIVLIFRTRRV